MDDDLTDLGGFDTEEAVVVKGLLESNGIRVLLRTARGSEPLTAYRMAPRRLHVCVAADRAEEARALLAAPPG